MNTTESLIRSLEKEFGVGGIYDPKWCLSNLTSKEERTVIITPDLAQQLLERTDSAVQRPIKPGSVKLYSKSMSEGRWVNNDQPIQRDQQGNIIDGRHRLTACVTSNKPFITKFINGVDREKVIHSIDIGVNRSKSDALAIGMLGEIPHIRTVAGAIEYLIHYSRGTHTSSASRADAVTNPDIMDWIDNNPKSYEEIELVTEILHQNESLIYQKYLAALYFIFRRIDMKKADKYINQLQTGIGLTESSPALYVRQKLIAAKKALNSKHKLGWKEKIILVIRGWNDYYENDGKMGGEYYHMNTKFFPTISGANSAQLTDAA